MLGCYLYGFVEIAQYALQADPRWRLVYYGELLLALPYVFAIFVLTPVSMSKTVKRRVGVPASLCVPYTRE